MKIEITLRPPAVTIFQRGSSSRPMAINKAMLAALKAISYTSDHLFDIKKNYRLQRQLISAAHRNYLKPLYRSWDEQVDCGGHRVPVRIYSPPQQGNHPILLFFHGGGWVTGNIDSYDRVCGDMARLTGRTVFSVDYRLAPEHPFPAGLEDCYAVARHLYAHISLFNVTPDQVTLIGDSAGGNLAAALSLLARQRGEFMPARQILLYPATHYDHSEHSPFPSVRENGRDYLLTAQKVQDYMELYEPDPQKRRSPLIAPLLAEDLSGQPKTLIITAEFDPLRDEGEAYGRRLQAAGVSAEIHRLKDALHGFISLPPGFLPVKQCYALINRFLAR